MTKKPTGWPGEPTRHAAARRGIKTGRKINHARKRDVRDAIRYLEDNQRDASTKAVRDEIGDALTSLRTFKKTRAEKHLRETIESLGYAMEMSPDDREVEDINTNRNFILKVTAYKMFG